jgi:hypothetical protein
MNEKDKNNKWGRKSKRSILVLLLLSVSRVAIASSNLFLHSQDPAIQKSDFFDSHTPPVSGAGGFARVGRDEDDEEEYDWYRKPRLKDSQLTAGRGQSYQIRGGYAQEEDVPTEPEEEEEIAPVAHSSYAASSKIPYLVIVTRISKEIGRRPGRLYTLSYKEREVLTYMDKDSAQRHMEKRAADLLAR